MSQGRSGDADPLGAAPSQPAQPPRRASPLRRRAHRLGGLMKALPLAGIHQLGAESCVNETPASSSASKLT